MFRVRIPHVGALLGMLLLVLVDRFVSRHETECLLLFAWLHARSVSPSRSFLCGQDVTDDGDTAVTAVRFWMQNTNAFHIDLQRDQ